MTEQPLLVLLVDDEASMRSPLADYLHDNFGYTVIAEATYDAALEAVHNSQRPFDVALIDNLLLRSAEAKSEDAQPESLGLDLMRAIQDISRYTEFILLTGWGLEKDWQAIEQGAFRFLSKASFDPDEIGHLIRQAAEMGRLKKVAREKHKLDIIRQVSENLNEKLVLQETLDILCQSVVDLFEVDHSGFVLFDESYQHGRVAAEFPEIGLKGQSISLSVPAEQELIRSQKYIEVADVGSYTPLGEVRELLLAFDIRSLVIMPAVFQGKTLGSFSLDSIGNTRHFDQDDIALCRILTTQAASAIDNALQFEETQRLTTYSPVAIVANDREGYITAFNRRAEELLDYTAKDIIGQKVTRLFENPKEASIIGSRLRESPNNRLTEHETYLRTKAGQIIPVRLSSSWLYDHWGKHRGALGHFEDITVQKRLFSQSRLQQSITDAIQSADNKDETIYLILTAITAGFGLGFNRAALFTRDTEKNVLVGAMGVGDLEPQKNQKVWQEIEEQQLTDIKAFRERVKERDFPLTPIGERIRELSIPIDAQSHDFFSKAVRLDDHFILHSAAEMQWLPAIFREKFEPQAPFIITTLRSEGEVIGILVADNKFTTAPIDDETVQSLITLSNTAAIALNKAQLLEQTQQQAQQLQKIDREAKELAKAEGQALIERIIERATNLLGAHSGGIYEYDTLQETLTVIADRSKKYASIVDFTLQLGEGMAGKLILSGLPYMTVDDYANWEERNKKYDDRRPFEAILEVPLKWRNEVIGVLYVEDEVGRQFSVDDVRLLCMFADHAAIALKNSRLIEGEQLAWQKLRESFEASTALAVAENPQTVLETAIEHARALNEALNAGVILLDNQNRAKALHFIGEDWTADVDKIVRKNGVSARVKQTGEPYICENTAGDPDINPLMRERSAKAAICLPFTVREERIGVMWVHYAQPHVLKDAEVVTLQLFAAQAAVAYDQARKIQTLEHMQKAADAISSTDSVDAVLRQIVESARIVLYAKSAAIWAYDDMRGEFVPSESVSVGIDDWEKFRRNDPQPGQTTFEVLKEGYVEVEDATDHEAYKFLGRVTSDLLTETGVGSFQGICLHVGDEKLGVLFVNYENPRDFNRDERQNIITFANHAAVALKKARLLEQVQHALGTTKRIARLSVEEGLEKTLTAVVDGAIDVLGCDAVVLDAYDAENERFDHPPRMRGVWHEELVSRSEDDGNDSIVFEMLEREEPYICPDTATDPYFRERRFCRDEQIKSLIAIPLKAYGESVGVLFINFRHKRDFSGEDVDNIQLFADQAAVAIHDARLYEREKWTTETLRALRQAGVAVMGSLELKEVLDTIAKQAWRLAKAQEKDALFADILLTDGSVGKIVSAYPPQKLSEIYDRLGKHIDWENGSDKHNGRYGITGRAFREGKSQRVADVQEDTDYLPTHAETRSAMTICIKSQEEIIGFIVVEHELIDAFTEHHDDALKALAAQAAVAIRNAQHVAEMKQIKGYVGSQNALDWMEMVFSGWRHKIGRIVGIAKADLLTLRNAIESAGEHKAMQPLERLEEVVHEVEALSPTELLSSDKGVISLKINDELRKHFKNWENKTHAKRDKIALQLELKANEDVTVRASRYWLRTLFTILSENSIEAIRRKRKQSGYFKVSTVIEDQHVLISFEDNGCGVPENVQQHMFKKRTEKKVGEKGAGVGLMQADAIVQASGGMIDCDAAYPDGARFIVQLPIEQKSN